MGSDKKAAELAKLKKKIPSKNNVNIKGGKVYINFKSIIKEKSPMRNSQKQPTSKKNAQDKAGLTINN